MLVEAETAALLFGFRTAGTSSLTVVAACVRCGDLDVNGLSAGGVSQRSENWLSVIRSHATRRGQLDSHD